MEGGSISLSLSLSAFANSEFTDDQTNWCWFLYMLQLLLANKPPLPNSKSMEETRRSSAKSQHLLRTAQDALLVICPCSKWINRPWFSKAGIPKDWHLSSTLRCPSTDPVWLELGYDMHINTYYMIPCRITGVPWDLGREFILIKRKTRFRITYQLPAVLEICSI